MLQRYRNEKMLLFLSSKKKSIFLHMRQNIPSLDTSHIPQGLCAQSNCLPQEEPVGNVPSATGSPFLSINRDPVGRMEFKVCT